jgi:hypothetical protein
MLTPPGGVKGTEMMLKGMAAWLLLFEGKRTLVL